VFNAVYVISWER